MTMYRLRSFELIEMGQGQTLGPIRSIAGARADVLAPVSLEPAIIDEPDHHLARRIRVVRDVTNIGSETKLCAHLTH